ncbi:MAG: hypothetical protein N3E49_03100 [Bacteroidia bacterium]|nr:hypothetical protein [Bacteroidia bacterium]
MPYTLLHQDSIWQEGARTWRAAARLSSLREAQSGLPIPVSSLIAQDKLLLLSLCRDEQRMQWKVLWRDDTLHWVSEWLSPRWLRRNLILLQGPRTWSEGRPPYKHIELLLPVAPRPQVPIDTLYRLNQTWIDSFILPWIRTLRLPQGRVTAIGLLIRYLKSGKVQYEKVSVFIQRHTKLPFDEKVYEVELRRLPRSYQDRFYFLRDHIPAYAYAVRLQDYYPETIEEARSWMAVLHQKQEFPKPVNLELNPSEAYGLLIK